MTISGRCNCWHTAWHLSTRFRAWRDGSSASLGSEGGGWGWIFGRGVTTRGHSTLSSAAASARGVTNVSAQPLSSAPPRNELTVRGLIIGILITLVFTAANVYFGLKAGLTFATSIPAAVISMAVLRYFKGSTMQENNIVQTVASAAGTLSSIIFVLPGLILIGWWTGFNYWTSFAICALGGILGVMYSIPLRRALVTNSDLPYP